MANPLADTKTDATDVFEECDDCGTVTTTGSVHECPTIEYNTGRRTAEDRARLRAQDDGAADDWVVVRRACGESPAYHLPTAACRTIAGYAHAAAAHPETSRTDVTVSTSADPGAVTRGGIDAAVPLVPLDEDALTTAIECPADTVWIPIAGLDTPSVLVHCHATFRGDVAVVTRATAHQRGQSPCQTCFDLGGESDE